VNGVFCEGMCVYAYLVHQLRIHGSTINSTLSECIFFVYFQFIYFMIRLMQHLLKLFTHHHAHTHIHINFKR